MVDRIKKTTSLTQKPIPKLTDEPNIVTKTTRDLQQIVIITQEVIIPKIQQTAGVNRQILKTTPPRLDGKVS